ncbi:MAG: site-specific integrase [Muribaculaceae bacterium]|nr:site-specific integrase [Muribaculaceae bacterium]
MASIKYIIGKRGGDRPEVILRLTIDNSLKVQSKVPGVLVYRQYWSEAKQCNDTSRKFIKPWEVQEMAAINKTLANLAAEVLTRATATAEEDITRAWLTAEVDSILHPEKYGQVEEAPKTLMQAVNDLIAGAPIRIVQRTGKPVSARTQIHYKQMRTHLETYLRAHDLADLDLADVNKDFYDSFVAFLYGQGLKLNTIGKHIKNIKAAINALPLAQRATCEFVEPKKCVKLTEEVDNIYLTETELEAIATLPIDTPYLDRVRDQFILLAWTGCRYSDLDKLTRDNIVNINGREFFKIEQQKTGARPTIPILPATRAILEKYGYNVPRPMANQKFNEYIKDVARRAGLTDEVKITRTEAGKRVTQRYSKWQCVSAHTARRSFATNMYKRDFPTLMIMKITGHQTEKAFLSYIKVTEDENAERMMKLFEEQEARRLEQGAGK